MKIKTGKRVVFHISPWRLNVAWITFAPLIILFLVFAGNVPQSDQGEKEFFWVIAGFFCVMAGCLTLVFRWARLELTAQGVRLRQVGYTLETAWSNINAIGLTRGAEFLVTAQPMTGKGCKRLAAAAQPKKVLAAMYDQGRVDLIIAHRLIPIEPFGWHLRHGSQLRSAILGFAPQLQAGFDALDSEPEVTDG